MGFAQKICSAFHKKIYQGTNLLSADELNTFRIKYRHLKVVIIDEITTVGNQTLSFIDTRLQQLTGTKAVFCGLSFIGVGELYQLKPLGDKFICLDLEKGASSLSRNLWKELFKMYELVDIMRQKDDRVLHTYWIDFGWMKWQRKTKVSCRHILLIGILVTIQRMLFICLPRTCMWMNFNDKILSQMPGEKLVIPCHDSVVSANISAKETDKVSYWWLRKKKKKKKTRQFNEVLDRSCWNDCCYDSKR